MGDRSGGREPKGASLKKSKKNPGAAAARVKKVAKSSPTSTCSAPPPPPRDDENGLYIDCGAALLSRQFDRDRERVLLRAQQEGHVTAMMLWFSDIEKQTVVADFCKANLGLCYCFVGVHPDNVDRTNKKSHEGWLEKVEELGRRPECLGIFTGLNLTREMGTHFAQETLLKSSCEIADRLGLPIILHASDSTSLDRAIETLREVGWTTDSDLAAEGYGSSETRRVFIHDIITSCGGNVDRLQLALSAGCYGIVSASGLTDPDDSIRERAVACVQAIPADRLVVCSDAPWRTPQNLPDAYLRTLRNEPANLPFVVSAIGTAIGVENVATFAEEVKANTLKLFGLEYLTAEQAEQVAAAATAAAASAAAAAASAADSHAEGEADGEKGAKHKGGKKSKAARDEALLHDASAAVAANKKEEVVPPIPPVTTGAAAAGAAATANLSHFACQRCRSKLFKQNEILSHDLDTVRTVFKVGDQGLCKSTIFLKCPDGKEISKRSGLSVRGGNVECSECGTKLGKYSLGEALCACGAQVPGPTVRINSAKVDFNDATLDADELAARSRQEAEEAARQDELDLEDDMEDAKGKRVKKAKKIRSENRGNFSNFRNKTFVPGAARAASAAAAVSTTSTAAATTTSVASGAQRGKAGKAASRQSKKDEDHEHSEGEEEEEEEAVERNNSDGEDDEGEDDGNSGSDEDEEN